METISVLEHQEQAVSRVQSNYTTVTLAGPVTQPQRLMVEALERRSHLAQTQDASLLDSHDGYSP